MPLLVCPNDNAAMQTVARAGVEFDFCPTCRGVWLDRGELEKLMSGVAEDESLRAARRAPDREPPRPGRSRDDDDYEYDYDDRRHAPRKRKSFNLLDIFD